MTKVYLDIDSFIADYPEAEQYRSWIGGRPNLLIFPGKGMHQGLPGEHLWASIIPLPDGSTKLVIKDSDDGAVEKTFKWENEAEHMLFNVARQAPVRFADLIKMGFAYA